MIGSPLQRMNYINNLLLKWKETMLKNFCKTNNGKTELILNAKRLKSEKPKKN